MSEVEFLNIRIWYLPGNGEYGNVEFVNFSTSEYDTCQGMKNMAMENLLIYQHQNMVLARQWRIWQWRRVTSTGQQISRFPVILKITSFAFQSSSIANFGKSVIQLCPLSSHHLWSKDGKTNQQGFQPCQILTAV